MITSPDNYPTPGTCAMNEAMQFDCQERHCDDDCPYWAACNRIDQLTQTISDMVRIQSSLIKP